MDTGQMLGRLDGLSLVRQRVGALPLVNHVLDRLRLAEILGRYLPGDDARLKIAPATVVGVVVRNLLLAHEPAYGIGAWAAQFDPALFGLGAGQVGCLSDDRIGRVLDRLFQADRASLFTALVVAMVSEFGVDTGQVHNDSTTVTPRGQRPDRGGGSRGGKPVPALRHGHNKDHRPDLPQLLFILTVSADGAVPLLHHVSDGNTNDDQTHIDTWNALVKLLGRTDFVYVADSKLATREQMDHIHARSGRFISILPRSRAEDAYFRRQWLPSHAPDWTEVRRRPGPRKGDPDDVWQAVELEPSAEGYRIVWVHSSRRAHTDATDRVRRIHQATAGLDQLNQRLAAPKSRTRDLLAADTAAAAVIKQAGANAWITHYTEPIKDYPQGRAAYRGKDQPRVHRPHFVIKYQVNPEAVRRDALSDGCYPIITNTDRSAADALDMLKHQPNLERRNHVLKTDQAVTPLHLHRPHRIEALLSCHFIALLVGALIERQIRQAMAHRNLPHLKIYPEDRPCTAPTTARIFDRFEHITRHTIHDQHGHTRTFPLDLTPIHEQIIDLLAIPHAYQ